MTVNTNPYPTPTQPAATHAPTTRRGTYGVTVSLSDDKPPVDPILKKVLEAVPFGLDPDLGVEDARRRLRDLPRREVHPDLRVENRTIGGPGGSIPIRVYWPGPTNTQQPPVVVFFHGGGFAVGDLDTHDGIARNHAVGAGAVVVSVGYRLAPEHPYPAAVEDVWAATRWVAAHGGELGADADRLAVAGDSAGGTLAAVVAQLARDRGGPPIAFQLLWYPATMWDPSLPSFTENADAPILDAAATRTFTRWYAGEVDMTNPPATLAPARADNLAGLPPAYIAVAGHDPLRDDGVRYAELLAAAGVGVQLHNADTMVHGYVGYAGVVPAATAAADLGIAALRSALHGR
jgi:acetyl esterase